MGSVLASLINYFKQPVCVVNMLVKSNSQFERLKTILKIKARTLDYARSWFKQHEYFEVQGPTIIPAIGDRPCSFEVDYFGRRTYLCQGLQPYTSSFVDMFKKIYTIAPTFRAEKLRTKRHLAEYWRIEVADSSIDLDGIVGVQEQLVEYICNKLSEDAAEELTFLHRSADDLAHIRAPFLRLTYDDAIERIQKQGLDVHWGEELSWDLEYALSLCFDKPFFVKEFPMNPNTFFYESHPQKPEITLTADLLAPGGYGEIASSGQMINKKANLRRKMKDEKIEPAAQRWYLSFKKTDTVSVSGFAMGIERLIQWICKLDHVKEATAFPRKYESNYP